MRFRRLSRQFERLVTLTVLTALAACGDASGPAEETTQGVEFDEGLRDRISISGVSSGAYLAVQAHIAFADRIASVAAIAGGPYHCAEGDVQTALARCMTGDGLDVQPLVDFTREFSTTGTIATLDDIARSRVWVFHSPADSVVSPTAGDALHDFIPEVATDRVDAQR